MVVAVEVVDGLSVANDQPLVLFGGLNVIEDLDSTLRAAEVFVSRTAALQIPLVFKASFDKANRSSTNSFRGVGLDEGLEIFAAVKERLGVPLITDIHEPWQAGPVGQVVDVIQIPAFLARQTDLLVAAARTDRCINVKKPQFMSPPQIAHIVEKLREAGNSKVLLCERGSQFGYDNLVVDMLGFREMAEASGGSPLIFDVTHSLQRRESGAHQSGGRRRQVLELARAGVAVGIAGVFLEAHPHPDHARCDGPSALPFDKLEGVLTQLKTLDDVVKSFAPIDIR